MRVTEILSACGLREWPAFIPQAEREWYLARGTAIHEATVLFDRGVLDWSSLDTRIVGFIRGYEKFRREMRGQVIEIEKEVVGPGHTGHLDRIFKGLAVCPAALVLADIKTNEADAVTRLQTMAYAMAYALAYGKKVRRAAISLFEDGDYRLNLYPQSTDQLDKAAWQACCTLAAWVQRSGA